MTLVARGRGGMAVVGEAVRTAIRDVDPQVAAEIAPLDSRLARLTEERRLVLGALGLFGGSAVLLVCLGIYGLMAYSAGARTREMAVRAALGAGRTRIVGLMVGSALRVALAGAATGLVMAFVFSRLLTGFLVDVGAADPATYGGVLSLLLGVAVAAALGPSVRAARRNPLEALRREG